MSPSVSEIPPCLSTPLCSVTSSFWPFFWQQCSVYMSANHPNIRLFNLLWDKPIGWKCGILWSCEHVREHVPIFQIFFFGADMYVNQYRHSAWVAWEAVILTSTISILALYIFILTLSIFNSFCTLYRSYCINNASNYSCYNEFMFLLVIISFTDILHTNTSSFFSASKIL